MASRIYSQRRMGMYMSEDTRSEMELSFKKRKSNDVVFTIIKRTGTMNVFSAKEFLPQIKLWKAMGAVSRYSNIREIKVKNETAYLFVVQSSLDDEERRDGMCGLSAGYGLMVEGCGYITTDKNILRIVHNYIGVDTMNGKGKQFCE
jgi:hypothetical protein